MQDIKGVSLSAGTGGGLYATTSAQDPAVQSQACHHKVTTGGLGCRAK